MANCLLICLVVCVVYLPGTFAFKDRILGGRPAKNHEFPYQVSLRYAPTDQHFCGGSLIDHCHILTAAHCMFHKFLIKMSPGDIKVVAGQNDLKLTENSIWRIASKIIVHRAYGRLTIFNDIAIIEFKNCFPNNTEKIAIAALNTRTPPVGTNCIVSGWGHTKPKNFEGEKKASDVLMAADVSTVNKKYCRNMWYKRPALLSTDVICAGVSDGSRGVCEGDSGGPLFCNNKLTGIASLGICGNPDYPGVFTDVSKYFLWIQNNRSIDTQSFTFFTFFILFCTVICL